MCRLVFSLLILSIMGCAAALVPESNSPRTKINQATILFNEQGRPVGAVSLLKQAIQLAKVQNDKLSEADAEFYLGEIYKSPGPRGVNLKNPQEAVEHFRQAINLYNELKFYKRSAFVSWNASAAYKMKADKTGECNSLREAETSHERSGGDSKDVLSQPFSEGNLLKSIRQLLKENQCQ